MTCFHESGGETSEVSSMSVLNLIATLQILNLNPNSFIFYILMVGGFAVGVAASNWSDLEEDMVKLQREIIIDFVGE
ncbi:transmembrane protein, putative [Medicago truncatula]|uniref:Transmembrane protein, putative n=1 Tax=Medicago truncatula TaxID=3880 RepID=G7JLP8_MEDTR|nr:transmembrane protein, putative [Medicago truncatula]